MNIVVFEDAGVAKLHPITTGRPAYAISCGSYRLLDWLGSLDGQVVGLVRSHLEALQLQIFPELVAELDEHRPWTLVVNARMVPSWKNFQRLKKLAGEAESSECQPIVVRSDWAIAMALVPTALFVGCPTNQWSGVIDECPGIAGVSNQENGTELFWYPHDVVEGNMNCLAGNLRYRIESGSYRELQPDVFVGADVQLNDQIVFDPSDGPIVLDDNVRVGPFTLFRGPVYVGPNGKISEHASLKDAVSIAHTCKIGGEMEGVVFEPFSNKQHYGFLGHAYVGSWVNLGAGTCNSDLKNTYGLVNMVYGDQKVSSGMQFMGCVIGDYAKTAINTSIFTGKLIGTASMVYGYATTNVPSFVNYGRTFGVMGEHPPEVVVNTQQRMFQRRDVPHRHCDIQLIHDMYELTRQERPEGLDTKPIAL